MHVSAYTKVFALPPAQLKRADLLSLFSLMYGRFNRRTEAQRDYNYQRAPHLEQMAQTLAQAPDHVFKAALELLDYEKDSLRPGSRHNRIPVIWALGMMKRAEALPELAPLLHHNKPGIRIEVARALGEIGDRRALPDLNYRLSLGKVQSPFEHYSYTSTVRSFHEGEAEALVDAIIRIGDKGQVSGSSKPRRWRDDFCTYRGFNIGSVVDNVTKNELQDELLSLLNRPTRLNGQEARDYLKALIKYGITNQYKYFCFDIAADSLSVEDSAYTYNIYEYYRANRASSKGEREGFILGNLAIQPRGREILIRINEGDKDHSSVFWFRNDEELTQKAKARMLLIRDHLVRALAGSGAALSEIDIPKTGTWEHEHFSFVISLPPQF